LRRGLHAASSPNARHEHRKRHTMDYVPGGTVRWDASEARWLPIEAPSLATRAEEAILSWGHFRSAAQWYRSMPDRVHLFDHHGVFHGGWCVGLDAALVFMNRMGGHLVYYSGVTDQPYEPGSGIPIVPGRPTAWERLLHDA
jgi:hypothetical protein